MKKSQKKIIFIILSIIFIGCNKSSHKNNTQKKSVNTPSKNALLKIERPAFWSNPKNVPKGLGNARNTLNSVVSLNKNAGAGIIFLSNINNQYYVIALKERRGQYRGLFNFANGKHDKINPAKKLIQTMIDESYEEFLHYLGMRPLDIHVLQDIPLIQVNKSINYVGLLEVKGKFSRNEFNQSALRVYNNPATKNSSYDEIEKADLVLVSDIISLTIQDKKNGIDSNGKAYSYYDVVNIDGNRIKITDYLYKVLHIFNKLNYFINI